MKSSAKYEREAEALRAKGITLRQQGEYLKADTITRKLIETWAAYHRAKEREDNER